MTGLWTEKGTVSNPSSIMSQGSVSCTNKMGNLRGRYVLQACGKEDRNFSQPGNFKNYCFGPNYHSGHFFFLLFCMGIPFCGTSKTDLLSLVSSIYYLISHTGDDAELWIFRSSSPKLWDYRWVSVGPLKSTCLAPQSALAVSGEDQGCQDLMLHARTWWPWKDEMDLSRLNF